MATAGKGIVLPSGKRGLLSGGKGAVFDGDGNCSTCCVEIGSACTYCAAGTTPDRLYITFAGVIACNGYPSVEFLAWLNGDHTVPQLAPPSACQYRYTHPEHNDPETEGDFWSIIIAINPSDDIVVYARDSNLPFPSQTIFYGVEEKSSSDCRLINIPGIGNIADCTGGYRGQSGTAHVRARLGS